MLMIWRKPMPSTALRPVLSLDMESRTTRNVAVIPDKVGGPIGLPVRQQPEDRFAFESLTEAAGWQLDELDVAFEPEDRIVWQSMRPAGRPSFTRGLLRDMNTVADAVQGAFERSDHPGQNPVQFVVTHSKLPGIFNLGGDLSLFLRLIEDRDRDGLRRYAHACARGQHRLHSSFDVPVCMIALVTGDALGGGFEAALAHDLIIAERQAQFGLPEVLFNLFPGMGAFSFLSRRIGSVAAERMILSGKVYSAEELHAMGVIDQVVDEGQGTEAIRDYVREFARIRLSRQAMLKTRKICAAVSIEELIDVTDVWVDTAMLLSAADLRRMAHLAKAQDRRWARIKQTG
ncbi:MAG: crotonase/enoyl-CoA hydratase family protein [Rhodospirillales bacterium]